MNRPDNPRKALGRGISTLLPTRPPTPPPVAAPPAAVERPETASEAPLTIAIDAIDANPLQPRHVFHPERLAELAQSIRSNGIIQPLVVRKVGDRYQLVAGERRWRAAKLAEMTQVPVVVRDIPEDRLLEITLIENIQREDLNPIETAVALMRMANELNLNYDDIGRRTGKDRTTISNLTRLLQLPMDLQQYVAEKAISAGHARCLLSLTDTDLQRDVAKRVIQNGWSVRETERVTQKMLEGKKPPESKDPTDPNVKAALQEMQRALGTRVRIIEGARGKGRIEIEYYSADDLDRIYTLITGPAS
jgi:ParB family transcriptional regulator, chromosome partitioning protein